MHAEARPRSSRADITWQIPNHVHFKTRQVHKLGVYKLKFGPSYKLKTGPSFFIVFPIFIVFFGVCLEAQIVSHCVKIVFLQNFGDVKNEVFEKKIAFFVFSFFMLEK